jgi:hypothetical protein
VEPRSYLLTDLGKDEDLQAALAQFAEWSEGISGAAGIEGSEPDWHSYEGRSERARAANEFQIAADLKK